MDSISGNMEGIGWPRFDLRWTLVGFHCYLIFSLNFVGLFAQQTPQKIDYRVRKYQKVNFSDPILEIIQEIYKKNFYRNVKEKKYLLILI